MKQQRKCVTCGGPALPRKLNCAGGNATKIERARATMQEAVQYVERVMEVRRQANEQIYVKCRRHYFIENSPS